MTAWQQLEIITTDKLADDIANLLHEYGALSVTLEDAADQPLFQILPEQTPLWQQTKILALFTEDKNVEDVVSAITRDFKHGILNHQIVRLEDKDWVRQTQQNFPPQSYADSLWVLPSWCDAAHYQGAVIKIDPGLAFGTGTHATTWLCLDWLARHPPVGLTVIDYGCGSGILALAALALGAKAVYAIDHDPQALQATKNNADLNSFVENKLHILSTQDTPAIKAPLILANILSTTLVELAPCISQLAEPKATLLISGILSNEIDEMARVYSPQFKATSAKTQEEWARLTLTHL